MHCVPEKIDLNTAKSLAAELTQTPPLVTGLAVITGCKLGGSDQYLSSILTAEDIDKLESGSSVVIFSPTGVGKSWTIESMALTLSKHRQVIILTNRTACETQLRQELFRKLNMSVPAELISTMPVTDNLEVLTYQKFTKKCNHYNGKNIQLFLDECHCLAEDAAFSTYPQQVVEFLRRNLDKTTRIYITATPEAVLPTIWKLESTSSDTKPLYPLTVDNLDDFLWFTPIKDDTRLQMVYLMQADWSYLTFQTYHPDEVEALADYLKAAAQDGKKSLIYINDIQKGSELQTLLEDSQHIYSDEDKRAELTEITQNACFASTALITTKVAENGISLHDDSLAVIVAETFDPIVLQQVIGRARVKRKKPREIVVLIPDYTASHLGSIMNKVYSARIEFDRASESPDFTMQYTPQPTPYIYYDAIAQKPTLNELGRKELQRQLDFLQQMRDEESDQPHAFVRYVLNLYGKDTTQIESLSIHYSKLSECHTRICTAWETFKESNMGADALADLKAALKAACNETGAYPKELKSNIQVDTVNDILRFAGIREKVLPESKVYKIAAITD